MIIDRLKKKEPVNLSSKSSEIFRAAFRKNEGISMNECMSN